ncbi:MAG: glycerophosphodiester phosphodiesterase [Candidatus Wallbacteria bacterium]|nr:glycerophosphodiester phosphodiesterase [Candidatus Wallbacteria bacterium]
MRLAYGHRGARALAPENTLAGFRLALELDVDGVEMDVHLSRDGHVVVIHDPQVGRTTNGRGWVKDLTLAELRALEASAEHAGRFPGERIPTLEESLELLKGRCRAAIELKKESPAALGPAIEVIRRMGMESSCSLLSFSPGLIREAARLAPEIARELIVVFPLGQVFRARSAGASMLDVPDLFVTRGVIERAHAAGLRVGTGITNDVRTMQRLVEAGVDSLYTDRPDLLVPLVRSEA